jgi:hypothetical protein
VVLGLLPRLLELREDTWWEVRCMLLVVASSLLGELLRRRSGGGGGGEEDGKTGDDADTAALEMCVECISAVIASEPGSTVHRLAVAYLGPLVAYSPPAICRAFVQVSRPAC